MLLGEYSERTGKTPQHKSTYTIDTWLCHRGSNPAPVSSHPDPQPLIRRWSQTRLGSGVGGWMHIFMCVCVIISVCTKGEERKSVSLQSSSQGYFSISDLGRGYCSGEPKKIRLRLFSLGASNRIPIPQLLSLSILVSTINFSLQSRELLHDRIHIAVNSLSLNADRSSHCFNHTGSLVRLWTAVPVFWILR